MRLAFLPIYILYLIAFISANLIVKQVGAYGLWISSFFLIPFDFIVRCIIQERLSKNNMKVFLLLSSIFVFFFTKWINPNAEKIALASWIAFSLSQYTAATMYQFVIKRSYFWKVNGSDLFAIITDSIVFQCVAFSHLSPAITIGQIMLKISGGLLWYYILFKRLKIQDKFI